MDPLGTYMQVEQIGDHVNSDYVAARSKNGSWGQNLFEPIPLTPEILEKVGGEFDDSGDNWGKPNYQLYRVGSIRVGVEDGKVYFYKRSEEDDFYSEFYPEIKTVHQLQNFHFAWTGEELNIEL